MLNFAPILFRLASRAYQGFHTLWVVKEALNNNKRDYFGTLTFLRNIQEVTKMALDGWEKSNEIAALASAKGVLSAKQD